MTVTELRQRRAETEAVLDGLVERIEEAVAGSIAMISLETARAMANEAGLHRFQDMALDSLAALSRARADKRAALAELEVVKDRYQGEVTAAEFALDGCFVQRANRTYLAVDPDTGEQIPVDDQKSMDAAERKAWKAAQQQKLPDVAAAGRAVAVAERRVDAANDEIAHQERSVRTAEHLLDAAREELAVLAMALKVPTTNGAAR